MSEHRYAERAAEWLRSTRAIVGPRPVREPDQAIATLASAIRGSRARRRAKAWIAAAGVALASGSAAVVIGLHARPPAIREIRMPATSTSSTITSRTTSAPFKTAGSTATALAVGDSLSSGTDEATLTAADGTSVRLAPKTEIRLVRGDAVRWLQLESGTIEAHVEKLAGAERFVIATPDRQVEVRGTRFRVSLVPSDERCGDGTVTRVSVEEGVVTVRSSAGPATHQEVRVGPGESWPPGCAIVWSVVKVPAGEGPRRFRRSPEVGSSSPSTLRAENDLLGRAVRAERSGDLLSALRDLDHLIAGYPSSPLRATAETERSRIVNRIAPPPKQ